MSFSAHSTKACFKNYSAFFQLSVSNKRPFFPPGHSLCFPPNVSVTTIAADVGPVQRAGIRLPKIVLNPQFALLHVKLILN